jgi:hypothetical protein
MNSNFFKFLNTSEKNENFAGVLVTIVNSDIVLLVWGLEEMEVQGWQFDLRRLCDSIYLINGEVML